MRRPPYGRINESREFIKGLSGRRKESKMEIKYDEKYYEFLDGLRETGVTNMFGASPYLQRQFPELDYKTAIKVLSDWMKTFGRRDKQTA